MDGYLSRHLLEECWVVLSQAESGSRLGFWDIRSTWETCLPVTLFSLELLLFNFLPFPPGKGVSFGPLWVKNRVSAQSSLWRGTQIFCFQSKYSRMISNQTMLTAAALPPQHTVLCPGEPCIPPPPPSYPHSWLLFSHFSGENRGTEEEGAL